VSLTVSNWREKESNTALNYILHMLLTMLDVLNVNKYDDISVNLIPILAHARKCSRVARQCLANASLMRASVSLVLAHVRVCFVHVRK